MNDLTLPQVNISKNYLRSINLCSDSNNKEIIERYVSQESSINLVKLISHHILETTQRAFTITGPYGGGKSSLAVMINGLISNDTSIRNKVLEKFKAKDNSSIIDAWNVSTKWESIQLIGTQESIKTSLGNVLKDKFNYDDELESSTKIIAKLISIAEEKNVDGLLITIDELGKFLDHAAATDDDIYFLQELAEAASRINGKLIILGVLHQSFDQYAHKLGRTAKEEWAKIQGRYVDLPFISNSDEVIELLGKAIEINHLVMPKKTEKIFDTVAEVIKKRRPQLSSSLNQSLKNCWPLHPIVSSLIGPISRKKFSQNERSIFSFLTSVEPFGLQEFILKSDPANLYGPDNYFDYLKVNFEQVILASSDGHRWAIAVDAIERAELRSGCTDLHLYLIKTIALLDLFKSQSGLAAEDKILTSVMGETSSTVKSALNDLALWSVIIFKKHLNAWALFSGSDFDIDQALANERSKIVKIDTTLLTSLCDLTSVVAKRHYHKTGNLRWYSKNIVDINNLETYLSAFKTQKGSSGEFLIISDLDNIEKTKKDKFIKSLQAKYSDHPIIFGSLQSAERVFDLGTELICLQTIQKNNPELEGDPVARKEVAARIAILRSELSDVLDDNFIKNEWQYGNKQLNETNISIVASEISDEIYHKSPHIFNELINKDSVSGNVTLARKKLMYQMMNHCGEEHLGFNDASPESSIFYSVILKNNLYNMDANGYKFIYPSKDNTFYHLYKEIDSLFADENVFVTLDDIFKKIEQPPYGIKKTLHPLIAYMYFLTKQDELVLYIEKLFIPELKEAYLDEFTHDPRRIAFKYFNITESKKEVINKLAKALQKNFDIHTEENSLDAARTLVKIIMTLPNISKNTMNVSQEARELRLIIKKANDPNKVIFNDIPQLIQSTNPDDIVNKTIELTRELYEYYPRLLSRFKAALYNGLDHKEDGIVSDLNKRASVIKGESGNFIFEAFVGRLEVYNESNESLDEVLGTVISRSPMEWVDRDTESALNKLNEMMLEFRKIETYGHLRGKSSNRTGFAFVYSDPNNKTISQTFDYDSSKDKALDQEAKELIKQFMEKGFTKDEILALLAKVSSKTIGDKNE